MQRKWLLSAAISGFMGVALGAFGAHGLKASLSEYGLDIYKTAVHYQMWHSLVLLWLAGQPQSRAIDWIGSLLVTGIVLFSGSLYVLAVTGIKLLGAVTPVGGVAFLVAWGGLIRHAWRMSAHR